MTPFILSRAAAADIADIWEYILEDAGIDRADAVREEIYHGILHACDHPHRGHRHDHLSDDSLRVWNVYCYLIVYWPDMFPLPVSRVIHGARDLGSIETPFP